METVAIRSRETGLPTDGMWDAGPVEVALSVLAAWKVPDGEVKRLTERAAVTAGSYGASYEQLGAVWGITRQGAREKWPDAVSRPAFVTAGRSTVALFGGTAELVRSSFGGLPPRQATARQTPAACTAGPAATVPACSADSSSCWRATIA